MTFQLRTVLRVLHLLIVSFVTASLYVVLLSFEPNPSESPVHLSFWENIIWLPLVFTIRFLPFVFIIGLATLFVKAVIKKLMKVKHIMLDIIVYVLVSIIVIPILPDVITRAATSTGYQFFINPYYLLPFTGAIILMCFDYSDKKRSAI